MMPGDTLQILQKLEESERRVIDRIDKSTADLKEGQSANTGRIIALETKVDQTIKDIGSIDTRLEGLRERFYKWLIAAAGSGGILGLIAKLVQEAIQKAT